MTNYTETKIIRFKGDYGDDINMQALDDTDTAFNLTGYTVKIYVSEPPSTLKFSGDCNLVTASEGKFKYTVGATDFNAAPKTYNIQAIATKTGVEITFAGVTVEVKEKHNA
jgi:hypothetical protein